MFCIADAEYLKRVNAAWTRILGWTETELLARPLSTFIHPDDVEVTKNVLGHMTEQDTIRFHNRYRKKDSNDYVIFEWNTTRWTDGLIYAIARPVPGSQLKRFTNIGNHQTGNENAT
jgi:PAS domain S-box-containing protein